MNNLDQTILSYAVRSRKSMMELSRSVKAGYFSAEFRDFFTILHSAFLEPSIKEVLSPQAMMQYCDAAGYGALKTKIGNQYQEVLGIQTGPETDFKFYLKLLKDRYNKALVSELSSSLGAGLSANMDIRELNKRLTDAHREINLISQGKALDEGTLGEDIVNIFKEYNHIATSPQDFKGVLTRFDSLDNLTNGFFGGELIIIAGFEGSGKSLVSMNWAINAWMGSNTIDTAPADFKDDGNNILYISLEMPRSNRGQASSSAYLNKRMVSCIGKLPFGDLRRGQLQAEDMNSFKKACKFIKEYDKQKKLFVADMPRGVGVDDVEAKLLEVKESMDVDLVVVDYIGLMKGAEDEADWKAQGDIAAGLHELARIYDVPIVTPCQVNRPNNASHSLNNQKYNTTRLARASGISQNANMVFVIESRDNEHQYQDMPFQIVKMRDAEKGELQFVKDFGKMRVYDPSAASELVEQLDDFIGVEHVSSENDGD
jgi:replicative DNA helicase